MKNPPAIIFALVALAAGAIAWFHFDSAERLRKQVAGLTTGNDAALKAAQEEIARLKDEAASARENVARLTKERDAALARAKAGLPGEMANPFPVAPPPAGDKQANPMLQGIAKMFSTEDGRKMMRSQMKMGLKMQYGDLAKALKLDPQTADQVLALLGDRQAALTEATFSAMKDGTMDEAAGKEIAAKAAALKADYDDKLKTVLGDDGMTQLQGYERTLGDRMMLNMHDQQFAASPMDATQRDALLQIMQAQRMQTPPSPFDPSQAGDPTQAFAAMQDDAAVANWVAQEQDYQQRVLQAATQTLNPDQISALQEVFKQQLEMQKFGMTMGKQMFTAPGASATITVTPGGAAPSPGK